MSLLHVYDEVNFTPGRWVPATPAMLTAGGGGGALARSTLLSAVTSATTGAAFADNGRPPSFSANVSGTGAVTATVRIEARNTASGVWFTLATITLSGTASAADGFASLARYMEYRAVLAAVSGTGAAVTVTMGS